MKNIYLPLILLFCSSFSFGQNAKIDSLKQVLELNQKNKDRVDALHKLFGFVRYSNIDQAEKYLLEAKELAVKLDYPKGMLITRYNEALLFYHKNNFKAGVEKIIETRDYLEANKDRIDKSYVDKLRLTAMGTQATFLDQLGEKEKAIKVYYELQKAIEKTYKKNSKEYIEKACLNYVNLANCYIEFNDSLALLYVLKAKPLGFLEGNMTNIGYNYTIEQLVAQSLGLDFDYVLNCLDSAIYYYKLADNKVFARILYA